MYNLTDIQRDEVTKAMILVIDSFSEYKVPLVYQEAIIEVFKLGLDGKWDIYNMDGCTCVPNLWVNKFTPVCTPHDGWWKMGMGGFMSDRLMTEFNKCYNATKYEIKFRFIGVRIGWIFAYRWKHLINGNVHKPTQKMKEAYKYYKLSKKSSMNYRAVSEVIAPLQAGLLAVISLTVKDVDIVLAIIIKVATIISIIFVCSYHYAKTKRIKKLNKQEDEKNIE